MAQSSINLIHILKPPAKTLLGSSLRIGFARAWLFTAMKVLLIASLIHGAGLLTMVEKNVLLLDQYVRNDFTSYDYNLIPLPINQHNTIVKVIVAQDFQPRGPALSMVSDSGLVAGAETSQ